MALNISSYDKRNDIIAFHKGFATGEKFDGNLDIGDLILDMSTKGRVRGLEIMNATEFLKDFGITEKILENLISAQFEAALKPGSILISISLKAKNMIHDIPVKIAVQLSEPITAQQPSTA